jgi:predicted phage terminase large subunit-like protein
MLKQGVSKEDLIEKVTEEVAASLILAKPILENNLYKFNKYVLGVENGKDMLPMGKVHKEMCDFIDSNKMKKKLTLIPRGHLKSTVVTVGRTVQAICADPSVRVLIANATYGNACSFLTEVKRHLKFNDKIKMVWGDLTQDSEKWSENQIMLTKSKQVGGKKEPTVTAMGVESNLTSQHYDIIIMDDVVNKDYVNTQEQIQKTVDFYKECLNLLEPNGEMIIIGTRWDDKDLYGWLMEPENGASNDFVVFKREAYSGNLETGEEFQALYPEKFSRKHLLKVRDAQGPYVFSCNYMNDPVSRDDATFKNEWFKYYDPTDMRGKPLNYFVAIDPAISLEREADYSVIFTVGVDEEGFIYVIDIERLKVKPSQLIDKIFEKWRLYGPMLMGIEEVSFQKVLQYSMTERMQQLNTYLPIRAVKPNNRTKDQRIRGLQPLYANGRILHCKQVNNIKNLEDELIRFPRGKHDDIIDALSYFLDFVFPAKRKKSSTKHKKYLY